VLLRALKRSLAERRQRRALQRVQRRGLADLVEDSRVRVTGRARPSGPAIEAPLSRRICVCYAVVIYDWHFDDSVRILHTTQGRAPFLIEEGGLTALVDPSRAQMSAQFDYTTSMMFLDDRDTLARLEALGVGDRDYSKTRVLELDEAIIELDERIAVIGTAIREPDLDAAPASYRDGERPLRWRLEPTAISDDPRLLK
jgi:hypothetical protein